MLNFEYELLNGYFEDYHLNFLDIQEKKQNAYIIDSNNNLKIFNLFQKKYVLNHQFEQNILSLSVNPSYNLFALAFENKVTIYSLLRNNIIPFCNLDVDNPIIQWNEKGIPSN